MRFWRETDFWFGVFCGCVVCAFLWAAIEYDKPPHPEQAIYHLKQNLTWLRYSKTESEYEATTAGPGSNLVLGEAKYEGARAAYDVLLTEMRDSLWGLKGSETSNQLSDRMIKAEAERAKFMRWRFPPTLTKHDEVGSTESLDPTRVVGVAVQLRQMQEAREQSLREYVLNELN